MFEDVPTNQWEFNVPCNLCGCKTTHLILENVQGNHHNLVECDDCGLRFFDPRLSWKWMYNEMVHNAAGKIVAENCISKGVLVPEVEVNALPPEQQKLSIQNYYHGLYVDLLKHIGNKKPLVLEVGSNIGWFLREAIKAGARPDSQGVDLCPHAVKIGRKEFGLNLFACPFCDFVPDTSEGFDMILTNDYIEHTYTPAQDLRLMRDYSHDRTVLFLKTFLEELDEPAGRTMICPPWHSYHFTEATLRRALEEAGWKVQKLFTEGVIVTVIAKAIPR